MQQKSLFLSQWPCIQESISTSTAGAVEEVEDRAATGQPISALQQSVSSGEPGPGNGSASDPAAEEVARFGAAKERKHSLEAGIALFNQ